MDGIYTCTNKSEGKYVSTDIPCKNLLNQTYLKEFDK
jgi:hypothetical protein